MVTETEDATITSAIAACTDSSKMEFYQRPGKRTVQVFIPGCDLAICAHRELVESHAYPADALAREKGKLRRLSRRDAEKAVPALFDLYFNRMS